MKKILKKVLKKIYRALPSKVKKCYRMARKVLIFRVVYPFTYKFFALTRKMNPDKVVFIEARFDKITDAFQLIYKRMKDEGYEVHEEYLLNNEVGCIFGNDSSAKPVIETAKLMEEKHDTELLGQSYIFQSMNSTINMNLSTIFHLKGVNFSVSAACASGSHSIGLGYMLIKQGLQDMVLCGGGQETNFYCMASFDALGAFSKNMAEPAKASRPFDRDRDGLVPSGGGAALVLEDYDHAVARGARIIAEVLGYGFSSNGTQGISQPSDDGCVRAMRRAMDDAGVEPSEIDYINAHATSTRQGDMVEATAIDKLFHGTKALISSTKSMTGHECWMAGASEVVYSLIMMQHNFVAPNINLENCDEVSGKLNLARQTVDTEVKLVLSNSFGFGGTNSALVIRKFE